MITQQDHSRRFGWRPFSLWIALTVVGYFLAGGFHFPTGFASNTYDPRAIHLGSGLVGLLFGAVSGLIIASLQWIVLRSWAYNARFWIPLNAVGYGLVHALGDAVSYMSLVLVGGGIIVGIAQYVALLRSLTRPILWIPTAAVAWFFGFQLGLILPHREEQYNLILAALIFGVVTGLALRLLLLENPVVPKKLDPLVLIRRWPNLNTIQRILLSFSIVIVVAILFVWVILMFGLG